MAKKKDEITEIVDEQTPLTAVEGEITKPLYKYEVGDEVFTMENNKVKSFVINKRVILTILDGDGNTRTEVYYDENNWASAKAQYTEEALFPSKKKLLESL